MQQLSFWNKTLPQVVNVASVPQRSPFRYPGGKTWLVPYIKRWLASLNFQPAEFIEPFCGGAIVGLNVAFDNLAEHVTLVELDEEIAAVWQTIITDNTGGWLANRIANFDLIAENLNQVLGEPASRTQEQAFQTILKNRVNRGGILAPGVGRIKTGENGKGLKSRWYPITLQKRILDISSIRLQLTFIQGDGITVLRQKATLQDAVFFIDPPYTVKGIGKQAGTRLYTHSTLDHEELFKVVSTLTGDFLMTYNNSPEVLDLARAYGFDTDLIMMKNTHHAKLQELLVGRNLDWFRRLLVKPIFESKEN